MSKFGLQCTFLGNSVKISSTVCSYGVSSYYLNAQHLAEGSGSVGRIEGLLVRASSESLCLMAFRWRTDDVPSWNAGLVAL